MKLGPHQTRWLEELVSDRHVQGKGLLHDAEGKKCCLGVACFIAKDELGLTVRLEKDGTTDQAYLYEEHDNTLPNIVTSWLGLHNGGGGTQESLRAIGPEPSPALYELNDDGWSFRQIAKHIQAHPDWFFKESK